MAVLGPPSSSNRGGGPAGVFDNIVQRASNPNTESGSAPPINAEGNSRRITMYRNGFTVDDGPLRDLTSPESREFLAVLERGHVPPGIVQKSIFNLCITVCTQCAYIMIKIMTCFMFEVCL